MKKISSILLAAGLCLAFASSCEDGPDTPKGDAVLTAFGFYQADNTVAISESESVPVIDADFIA